MLTITYWYEKSTDQHDTSVEQRKNLSPCVFLNTKTKTEKKTKNKKKKKNKNKNRNRNGNGNGKKNGNGNGNGNGNRNKTKELNKCLGLPVTSYDPNQEELLIVGGGEGKQ